MAIRDIMRFTAELVSHVVNNGPAIYDAFRGDAGKAKVAILDWTAQLQAQRIARNAELDRKFDPDGDGVDEGPDEDR